MVSVEALGEGGGIGLDIYCPFLRKVLPRFLFNFVSFRLVLAVINNAITHVYSVCSSSAHVPAGVDSEERLAVAAVAIECRIDECNILTIKFLGRTHWH